jgi:pyrroloquinoline-quinone synthase
MSDLRALLEETIHKRHLLDHEWYLRWQAGKLGREELQGYAKEYYAFEREFPRFISAIHSRCEDARMRQLILENLIHEEKGEENHPELWLRFAEGLDVPREVVENHFHSDETEQLLRVFRKHSSSANVADGLAALYAYESQQPEVAKQKCAGLKKYYGVDDEATVSFFKAHQTYDVYHSETEAILLEDLCQDRTALERAQLVVEETLNALYDFLDGVERRYRRVAA